MFEGFSLSVVDTGDATLRVRHGGNGPPVLLLHGHPQTHIMDVRGHGIDCGHYLAEEAPEETYDALHTFLT